jgi:hypothetical protein
MENKMRREKAKNIITNLYSNIDRIDDELTRSILEFCVMNDNTHSYTNLITFVSNFENTQYIIQKFRILDVSQIVTIEDLGYYKSFLLMTEYEDLLFSVFNSLKYLVKYANAEKTWYELLDEPPVKVNTNRIKIRGALGFDGDVYIFACRIILDTVSGLQEEIRKAKEEITNIKIENNRKRYYVKKIKEAA